MATLRNLTPEEKAEAQRKIEWARGYMDNAMHYNKLAKENNAMARSILQEVNELIHK